jgi:hypothetical protein
LKIFNFEYTSAHLKDHSCELSLESDKKKRFEILHWGSFGHIHFVLAYCNETSQELSLGCVDVHVGIDIFKMAAIAMVTMKVFFYQILMKVRRNDP